jgi:hypothetical protein
MFFLACNLKNKIVQQSQVIKAIHVHDTFSGLENTDSQVVVWIFNSEIPLSMLNNMSDNNVRVAQKTEHYCCVRHHT